MLEHPTDLTWKDGFISRFPALMPDLHPVTADEAMFAPSHTLCFGLSLELLDVYHLHIRTNISHLSPLVRQDLTIRSADDHREH